MGEFCIKKYHFLIAALIFFCAGVSCAQSAPELTLNSKNSIPLPEKIEEYRLSLGSTMIGQDSMIEMDKYKIKNTKAKFVETPNANFDSFKLKNEVRFSTDPEKANNKVDSNSEEADEYSTLTLTTDYLTNSIGYDEKESGSSLSMKKKIGKWAVYGEFERKKLIPIPIPSPISQLQLKTLASIRENSSNTDSKPGESQEKPNQSDKNSALSSRYYLEAVYNFLPTVKGKLSYKRSMIDTYDSEEKLQVEGIVEANKNMLIKAGYNNETRPEVNDPKTTKDTKVWTEFILKF